MRNGVQDLINNLKALGRTRLMILGGVSLGLVLALLLGVSAVSRKDFAPLYKNLSMAAAGSIETTLIGAGFDARMAEDGASVSVPRGDLARARMVLAESGLPIEGDPGWELFDDASGLAMNSFMQRVNRLRAMEGELARSIQTLDGVQSARVHLVLPEREAFSRERPEPRASIIVRASVWRARWSSRSSSRIPPMRSSSFCVSECCSFSSSKRRSASSRACSLRPDS